MAHSSMYIYCICTILWRFPWNRHSSLLLFCLVTLILRLGFFPWNCNHLISVSRFMSYFSSFCFKLLRKKVCREMCYSCFLRKNNADVNPWLLWNHWNSLEGIFCWVKSTFSRKPYFMTPVILLYNFFNYSLDL